MRARVVRNALVGYSWTGVVCTLVLADVNILHDPRRVDVHSRRWARVLLRAWGVEVAAHGLERLPRGERCVLLANHQSYSDVVALFHALPVPPVFMAKQELRRIPMFGRAMEAAGHVFVDRGKHQSAVETVEQAARGLTPDHPLLVFPEGTRGRRAEIQRFKKGGFHLARKAGVPIVPIGIRGSRAVWPREAIGAMPGRIEIHVGEPISAEDVESTPLEELIARVRERIAELSQLPLA